ncbi:uncharacterized protein LOC110820897 isoform X3 [Carica papaya]|uniref:uncharacterized protein LOC110820897 isoform X3 n=1 Tax=Carica papaya TaxID=3649 RepID=UPI000B8CC267|nr:uncharacterized protein LOC110820897 isoform X3 [Carica papaya]
MKRFLQKAAHHYQHTVQQGDLKPVDLDPRIVIHYGIPSTASILAFDPIQRLLAIGTLDGRIKVIGGDGIEGILISSKQLAYKNLEFLQNQGFLVSISNENYIEVWNLEKRCLACCLQWHSNITAFSVIRGSHFMYIGDEYGLTSVLKYDAENEKLLQLPYNIPASSLNEAAGFSSSDYQVVVGILPQPCSENRGGNDLQLKDGVNPPREANANFLEDGSEYNLRDKEISCLCWASSDGSILAVGYIDGDILFWNTSYAASTKRQKTGSSKNIVKLQLSTTERRLPVIVLHWSRSNKSCSSNGQLFIYGGDEIGSEEVLTILSLEWSSGMDVLKCVGRVDLILSGSFADMILLPNTGATEDNHQATLFVLTNPGQLHLCDDSSLSALLSQQERKRSVCTMEFPAVIPTADPSVTVAKFSILPAGGNSSKGLSEIASTTILRSTLTLPGVKKWPLTGGVLNHSAIKENSIERLYIAGYQDGSVRMWDATYPVLFLTCVVEAEVQGIKVAGLGTPVTALNFCFISLILAIGNECGLVCIYDLNCSLEKTCFCYVGESKHEVYHLPQHKGPSYRSIFGLTNSPVQALEFSNNGAKLAVGFECGRIAMLDVNSSSILFFSGCGTSTPIMSITWKNNIPKSLENSGKQFPDNSAADAMFVLTKDASVTIIDPCSGSMMSSRPLHQKKEMLAISMYIIEGNTSLESDPHEKGHHFSSETEDGDRSADGVILICCEDQLRLHSIKSVILGNNKTIHKVKHTKPCCWTTTFKKDGEVCGLVLFFQTGIIEIRSLPDLELVKETSLMSILNWNFKVNMDKTMSSSDHGHITLANGSEVAFISLLVGENDFRIPDFLPCLHDKVLEAAADGDTSFFPNHKRNQGVAPGILGGIVKGFKGEKVDITAISESKFSHLESIFLKCPFSAISPIITDNQEILELNIGSSVFISLFFILSGSSKSGVFFFVKDDIEIDETPPTVISSHESEQRKRSKMKGKRGDKEKLLGVSDHPEPRVRTAEEIIAKYRKSGDASSAAEHARHKLEERREKLERISKRTEELQSGAENFESLAKELAKAMENRKWWQL